MPKDGTVHELTSNVSQHFCVTPVDLFALSAIQTQHLSTRIWLFSVSGGATWFPSGQLKALSRAFLFNE